MFTKILMPTDGAPRSVKTAEYVRGLVKLNPSAQVTILYVRQGADRAYHVYRWLEVEVPLSEEVRNRIREAEERILTRTAEAFREEGIPVETMVVKGVPAEEICAYAGKGGYDLIVMGSRNLSELKELFSGSVSHRVMHLAKCPVLVVKR
jgi:nucleotide-binding universal stress UspA family protein